MRKHLLLFLLLLLCAASPAGAEFYQWTDGDGRVFYTNERDKVPPQYRGTLRPVEVREDRVSTGTGPAAPHPGTAVKAAPQTDLHGRDEKHWRSRAEGLRRKISAQQAERDRLVKKGKDAEKGNPFQTKSARKARKDRERKLAKIDKKIARLRHELEVTLPDEARKAGALPGWVR